MKHKSLPFLLGGLCVGGVVGVGCQKSKMALPTPNLLKIEGFNAKAGSAISLSDAQQWVRSYRTTSAMPKGGSLAYYFGNEAFKIVQNQPGCVGIRFYNAIEPNGDQTLVYVGVDKNGHDILSQKDAAGKPIYPTGNVVDASAKCPPACDDPTTPILEDAEKL